jgi:hypothetical protein
MQITGLRDWSLLSCFEARHSQSRVGPTIPSTLPLSIFSVEELQFLVRNFDNTDQLRNPNFSII